MNPGNFPVISYVSKLMSYGCITFPLVQDAGKSQQEIDAITEPKEEIEFVANGVVIYEKETKKE